MIHDFRELGGVIAPIDPELEEKIHWAIYIKKLYAYRRWTDHKLFLEGEGANPQEILDAFIETRKKIAEFMRDFCRETI